MLPLNGDQGRTFLEALHPQGTVSTILRHTMVFLLVVFLTLLPDPESFFSHPKYSGASHVQPNHGSLVRVLPNTLSLSLLVVLKHKAVLCCSLQLPVKPSQLQLHTNIIWEDSGLRRSGLPSLPCAVARHNPPYFTDDKARSDAYPKDIYNL